MSRLPGWARGWLFAQGNVWRPAAETLLEVPDMRQGDSERREYVRQTVLLPCRVDSLTTSETMYVINVSAGGCLVATRGHAIQPGTQVTVHTKLDGVELPLTGRVAHARDGWGFAMEFVNLADDTRQHLEHFLAMEPTPS